MSENLISLVINKLGCSQKELAERLGVSQGQISKWKKGEYMSLDMHKTLSNLAQIEEGLGADFVVLSNGIENAKKWNRLICDLGADVADDIGGEIFVTIVPLIEDTQSLSSITLNLMSERGLTIPSVYPDELDIYLDDDGYLDFDKIRGNMYSKFIYELLESYSCIYAFYSVYIEYMNEYEFLYDDVFDLECNLLALAACKLGLNNNNTEYNMKFINKTRVWFWDKLSYLKEKAFYHHVPFRNELFKLMNDELFSLKEEAEIRTVLNNGCPDYYLGKLIDLQMENNQFLESLRD